MKNKGQKHFIIQARRTLKTLNNYYYSEFSRNNKSDFQKLFCTEYIKLEQSVLTVINNISNVKFYDENFDEIIDILNMEVVNCEFKIDTHSLENIMILLKSTTINLFYNLANLLVVITVNDIVSNITTKLQDKSRLSACLKLIYSVGEIDINKLATKLVRVEQILLQDPTGDYANQSKETSAFYRYMISELAMKLNVCEAEVAENALDEAKIQMKHIGFSIYNLYLKVFDNRLAKLLYMFLPTIFTVILSIILSLQLSNIHLLVLLYLPIYRIIEPIINNIILKGVKTIIPFSMNYNNRIPAQFKSIVVISMILSDSDFMDDLYRKIEYILLTNSDKSLDVTILADFKECNEPFNSTDKVLLSSIKKTISQLNNQYDNRVIFLVRAREFSITQQKFIGLNRKYGAISQLVSMLCDDKVNFQHSFGDISKLKGAKYMMLIDYDTILQIDSVYDLVCVATHPLNTAAVDKKGQVISGYGIINPKISLELKSSLKNSFTSIMGGIGGITSYKENIVELNQAVFGSSIFTGKGLVDVNVYHKVMQKKLTDETVLSHDILEGIYLKTLFVGDIEVLDNFPENIESYIKRLHRWVRGDTQNIPFIFSKVKFAEKFKLIENIRRAISPIFCLLLILNHSLLLRTLGVVSILAPYLFSAIIHLVKGYLTSFTSQTFTNTLPIVWGELQKGIFELILLPQIAYTCFTASCTALYRRFFTKRKLLEWTTSHQVSNDMSSSFVKFAYNIPNMISSIILILNGGIALSILFLASLLISYSSKKKAKSNYIPTETQREKLIDDAKKMLQYYRDNMNEENNYLPPDSIQFSPVYRVCDRTSPTNIGMMLLSFLSAVDLKIINIETMTFYILRAIESVERLQKFHGNLYNWYDIKTLEVLPNKFVSAVDSGNFLCCLVALKQGLLLYKCDASLIKRIETLLKNTDLSVFYDSNKKLFSIGFDSEIGELSKSHYDMLMSEARMMSYYAIAIGVVPKDHWQALSRTLSRQDNYTGAISWTGTMFEYFMPELLLHSARGSLSYESLNYSIFCQKNRVKGLDIQYGISESAIYSFDGDLNYQYNPNGVQRLALKSEQNKNLVISPYSSYLTLSLDFEAAYQNLNSFENCSGIYGNYECIDYTESRVGRGSYRIVRSFMAHHIGMSITAIANALCNNVMQRRFLSDKWMGRAYILLQEKMKIGEIMLLKQIKRERAKSFMLDIEKEEYFGELHPLNPRVKLLNNGDLSLVLSDIGVSEIIRNRINITRHTDDILKNPLGSFCFININDNVMSLTYAPSYDANIAYESSMTYTRVNYYAKGYGVKTKISVGLCQSISAEVREISIINETSTVLDTSMISFVEPCLQSANDFRAHKTFSKLFINIENDKSSNCLIVTRKQRDNSELIYVAVGFANDVNYAAITNRDFLFERNKINAVKSSAFTEEITNETSVTDQTICLRTSIKLQKGENYQIKLITAIGNSKQVAINNFNMAKCEVSLVAEKLKKDSLVSRITQVVLPQVLFGKYDSSKSMIAKTTNILSAATLNKFSINENIPLILVELFSDNSVDRVTGYVDCYYHLLVCGIKCTLVFICEGESDIIKESLGDLVTNLGCSIIIIEKSSVSADEINLLTAVACHIATRSLIRIETPLVKYTPFELLKVKGIPIDIDSECLKLNNGHFSGDSFFITSPPQLPWCHILANATFGTLLSDKSLGFTWAINSRQNKLTPWSNDTLMDNIGELIIAREGNEYYNLVDGATVEFNPQYAKYCCNFADYTCIITVYLPSKGMIKYIKVELENCSRQEKSLEIAYYNSVVLGVDKVDSRLTKFTKDNETIVVENPSQFNGRSCMGVSLAGGNFDYTCDSADFYTGNWGKNTTTYQSESCVAISKKIILAPNEKSELEFIVAFSMSKNGLDSLIKLSPKEKYKTHRKIDVLTDNKPVNYMVNTWLPHQIAASRLFGRTAFYQCGGAYGFRDQLQDAAIYAMLEPSLAKTHIIRCCAVQFEEGDVLHWWHTIPNAKNGVRSRYSDDLVWLVYSVCEYISITGDFEITSVMVRYLTANELHPDEKDRYLLAEQSDISESVYNHCKRALRRAYNISDNGLVKIGAGDWNDGYSNVGINGDGVSVWLSQFLALTLKKFSRIASRMDDKEMQDECINRASRLLERVDAVAYDTDHYIRAIYDNGDYMGANSSDECKIDSLTQSFAALSDMQDEKRVITALETAYDILVDKKFGIIKLFYPPFADSFQEPGYVKAYPKGVRENGGQYTHAAIWFAMAMKKMGKHNEFFDMIDMLNPINKYLNNTTVNRYMLEPYYIAADIYTNEDAYGRGGWSIYTGSAAWYYKLLVCDLLGINIEDGNISFSPTLPDGIRKYKAFIKDGDEQIDYTNSEK